MVNKKSIIIASIAFLATVGPVTAFAAGPAPVDLGSAGSFVILGKTGISTTGTTVITGNIGVSPVAATYITGFGPIMDVSNTFSTSALVNGKIYASDYTEPTPATMTAAISAMETAYTDAAGRTLPTATELGAGNIGGMTLAPGLYKWGTDVTIPSDVTLSGTANDVWIFQIAGKLDISSATKVILSGGAQASNIFWQVAGQTTIGTGAVFNGNILDQTAIVLNTGATLNGRALAQSAVTLDASVVTGLTATVQAPVTPVVTATPATPAIPATSSQTTSGGYTYTTPATPAVPATPASAATNAVLQSQLDGLVVVLQQLHAQIQAKQQGASGLTTNVGQQVKAIVANLRVGTRGDDVKTLQQFLVAQAKGVAAQALAKNGTTTTFGNLTRAALAEFQASVGISPALGNFGSITRAYIQANY
ncbi:MAG: hypothetical protein ACD_81C00184G0001 [uncultured bacterium]|uniref:Peptidoglycan binding-like domain-containing protein n=2 Tax=Candidatus Wolfeibacteriota TaxID=1752735 RepID=A0A0G1H7W6_9BACT|nr:MAG: hypothetical protein ACD_81C00184G0001 [uncultured bacterium]KKR12201.1 MAG: hypothetical protein UT41_C0003G0128 [Candidatus Wolfebacteria bacterium GW2011_GWC2_39_22]KKT42578.1 MAG: hypothetical protein UW32_C0005G0014 [Candidatus Wolfebacteria bacterium GW2011_GWE2_44_13]